MKNDWFLQVKADLEECQIDLSECEIANMRKYSFNKLVNEKINLIAAQYLIGLKERHSKSLYLKYSTEMQPYLRDENLSIQNKKLMFKIKNRLIDVKINFKKKYNNNLECRLCSYPEESQAHLIKCSEIIEDEEVKTAIGNYSYEDLFSCDLKTQTHLIKAWQLLIKVRKIKMKKAMNNDN